MTSMIGKANKTIRENCENLIKLLMKEMQVIKKGKEAEKKKDRFQFNQNKFLAAGAQSCYVTVKCSVAGSCESTVKFSIAAGVGVSVCVRLPVDLLLN